MKHDAFYCGRGDAPPVDIHGDKWGNGATPQERIRSRLLALQSLAEGIRVARCVVGYPTTAKLASVSVQGDVATVDFNVANDDWGYAPTSYYDPLIAEIVYTATEEPGIRRVRITQNGGQLAWIHEPARATQGFRHRARIRGGFHWLPAVGQCGLR